MSRNKLKITPEQQELLKKQYAEAILSNPNYYINESGYLDYRPMNEVNLSRPTIFDRKRRSIDYVLTLVKKFKGTPQQKEALVARIRAVDFLAEYFPTAQADAALATLQSLLLGQFKRGATQGVRLQKAKRRVR